MKTPQMTSSAFSIGVHESEHTVRTDCPHCQTRFSIVLASTDAEGEAMQKALDRVNVSQGFAKTRVVDSTYATRIAKPKARPSTSAETRHESKGRKPQVTANEMVAALRSTKTPVVPPHMLRPRFRYYAADRRKNPETLSPTRRKIYSLIAKATERGVGAIESDLLARGFAHGSIQQTLHWLREHGWVRYTQEIPAHVD